MFSQFDDHQLGIFIIWNSHLFKQNFSRIQSHLILTRPSILALLRYLDQFIKSFLINQGSSLLTWFSCRCRASTCKSTDHHYLSICCHFLLSVFGPNFSLILQSVNRFHRFFHFLFFSWMSDSFQYFFEVCTRVLLTDRPRSKVKIENNLNLVCTSRHRLIVCFRLAWNL